MKELARRAKGRKNKESGEAISGSCPRFQRIEDRRASEQMCGLRVKTKWRTKTGEKTRREKKRLIRAV